MEILRNASLKRKLNGSFVIVFIFILVIGVFIYRAVLNIQDLNSFIESEGKVLQEINNLRRNNVSLRYRTRRLYTSTKEKNAAKYKAQAIDEVDDMYDDLATMDSIYARVSPFETDELNNYVLSKKDSVREVLATMIPNLDASFGPYLNYIKYENELDDYLDRDSLVHSEVKNLQKQMKTSLNESRESYEKVFQTYGVINRHMGEMINEFEATISSHQNEIQDIINQTLIIVLVTTGIALVIILVISSFLVRIIVPPVNKVVRFLAEFASGKFPDIVLEDGGDEIGTMAKEINKLKTNLVEATAFAEDMGQGNFHVDFKAKDALGQSLLKMNTSFRKSKELEDERKFISEGLAKLNTILRQQTNTLEELGDNVLYCIIKYLGIQVGALYTVEKNNDDVELKMEACYAYDRKKFIQQSFQPGEGIVGQAYVEAEPIHLIEIPDDYMKIRSGLGDTPPGSVYATPLVHNDTIVGILEFASIQPITPNQIQFIEEASNAIASDLSTQKVNKETRRLLDETQKRTEQMQAQEEELRQNMEELQATQENVVRSENRTKAILASIQDGILTVDSHSIIGTANNAACKILGYSENELMGENITTVMPSHYFSMESEHTGQTHKIDLQRKNGQPISVELTVQEATAGSEKILVAVVREV